MFLDLVTDIATHVNLNGEHAVEFATDGFFLLIFTQLWRTDELCRVFLKRTSRLQGQTSAERCLISNLMEVLSTTVNLICSIGCGVRYIQLIYQSPYSKFSVQSRLDSRNSTCPNSCTKSVAAFWQNRLFLSLERPGHLLGWMSGTRLGPPIA